MDVETAPVAETSAPPSKAPAPRAPRGRPAKAAVSTPAAEPDALSPFQAAYAQAKEQHSATAAEPAPADARTEPEDESTPTQSKAPEPDASTQAPEPTFLSDEEASALQTEFADDPAGYRKALDKRFNKALTQSTQKLSALRKSLEPYADTLDGLDSDPQSTIRALAKHYGVSLTSETATETKPRETPADALVIAREALGPELEWMADKLAPAIEKILDRQLGKSVEPLRQRLEQHDQRSAEEEVASSMKAFEADHPNWKQHEDRMMALAQSFPASPNVSIADWMTSLYKLATYDTAVAAGTQQAIQRMTKAAKTSEASRPAVDGSRVHAVMPTNATFRDAAEAAKRGEVWQHRR